MDNKTAKVITPENARQLSFISGIPLKIMEANYNWAAVYHESYMPRWLIMPKWILERDFPDVKIL